MAESIPCVFCEIVDGRSPAHVVFEDELTLAILDINPLAAGHCLVIPKRHVPWWHDMSEAETTSLFNAARIVAGRLMEVMAPDFVAMYARGRRIPHTHIFLVPTFQSDPVDRFFNALEGFQESAAGLAALRDRARLSHVASLLREP